MLSTLYKSRTTNKSKTLKNVKMEQKIATNVLLKNNNTLKTKAINILTDLYHKKLKERERSIKRSRRMAQMKNELSFKEIYEDIFTAKNKMSGTKSNLWKSNPKTEHSSFENAKRNNGMISEDYCVQLNKNIR